MLYNLEDLLMKIGTPGVQETHGVEWHYFRSDVYGLAEVRLEAGGARLVAELRHVREPRADEGEKPRPDGLFVETCSLRAERGEAGLYAITRVAFDGMEYTAPEKAVTELALSVFHARALDISMRMAEQSINKSDICDALPDQAMSRAIFSRAAPPEATGFGVVVPFRPRRVAVPGYWGKSAR